MNNQIAFDLILKNATTVLPGQTTQADIGVISGKIAFIGDLSSHKAEKILDLTGLHILPGVIDTQVHFREPGATHKEDLWHGTRAAIAGGVTGIFEMPNTTPLTITPEALTQKMNSAAQNAWCDYAFYFGGTADNAEHLSTYENLQGVCGVKIFMGSSTGSLLAEHDADILKILQNGRRVVAVHAEDEAMMRANKESILGNSTDVAMHPVWRSTESCVSATSRLLSLARKAQRRVHVLHISTADELPLLQANRDIASCEVLPNHLTLSAPECYERYGTYAQQNPPIREKHHQDALWQAISQGLIDVIGSDHAPHTREEKDLTYPASPSGTPGVQTLVPLMLNHVNAGRLTLERFVDMTAYAPQRIHHLATKGRIAAGYDADFTIIDLKTQRTITNEQQKSKAGWTIYDNYKVTGWPVMTIIRGQIKMQDDELIGVPDGKAIEFQDIKTV
jgi:dihydroorotase